MELRRVAGPLEGFGLGFKPAFDDDLWAEAPPVDFWEVHAENYLVSGGPMLRMLDRLRQDYPLTLHGVGLSIGGEEPLDALHLSRLALLVERCQPAVFSEHLAWSSHAGTYFNDLLPLPYGAATLQRVCDHVDQVQSRLRRQILMENPSTYVRFTEASLSEAEFLSALVQRTGCGVLLDVNNLYVSAINHGEDLPSMLAALPWHAVGQIHLAGYAEERDGDGGRLLIDHHGAPVSEAVWSLYQQAVQRLGPVPTLIERDQDVPPLRVQVAELALARRMASAALEEVPA